MNAELPYQLDTIVVDTKGQVNWSLRSRVTDNTRAEYGWSYRTEQIQIILMQEIRDALIAQNVLLRQLAEKLMP